MKTHLLFKLSSSPYLNSIYPFRLGVSNTFFLSFCAYITAYYDDNFSRRMSQTCHNLVYVTNAFRAGEGFPVRAGKNNGFRVAIPIVSHSNDVFAIIPSGLPEPIQSMPSMHPKKRREN